MTSNPDIATALDQLQTLIGKKAYRALQSGTAYLHIWKRTAPRNWWIGPKIDRGMYLWHSSRHGLRPHLALFEHVESPDGDRLHEMYKLKATL